MVVRNRFVCQSCGASYGKWQGRCDECGEWNTLVEQPVSAIGKSSLAKSAASGQPLAVDKLRLVDAERDSLERIGTGLSELDEVLGGGIVPGGVVLLAGQPGIGKSTLLLQTASSASSGSRTLYVSGEESAGQVRLRAGRLRGHLNDNLDFAATTNAADIAATIGSGRYQLVIIDSIQTMSLSDIASAPGTISQITGSGNLVIRAAKESGTAVIMVGHVTKEGSIAGPKVLEHLVDVVLQFEGDRYGGFRVVRAAKNRYGSTNETAILEMRDDGLVPVINPSAALLAERSNDDGSIVLATMEGSRPLLVEIQALVNPTSFGYPKRTASGFDLNRLNLLTAVLERRTKLNLSDKDIYLNVVGGLRLNDPAADLAVAMAIASASASRTLDDKLVVFGEVGLGGEVRSVTNIDKRIQEARKIGFRRAIGPRSAAKNSFVDGVGNLREALIKYLQ